MPRGRAVVFASGAPATLIETVSWMRGPQAEAVRASIAVHDPAGGAAAATGQLNPSTQAWLDASSAIAELGTIDGMVILDDDFDMAHLAPWHVKTDGDLGFTEGDLRAAAEVLSRPMPGASPRSSEP